MIPAWLERTQLLIGETALSQLQNTSVLIVGMGGVGSFAAEYIARSGIGKLCIVDGDMVDASNKNRQLVALDSTVGCYKVDIMAQRIIDIAPNISLISINKFLNPEDTLQLIQEHDFDFVMDCIDSITPKINLIKAAHAKGCKVISSMGAGAKIDPSKVSITDISKTNTCPFAYYIRKRLKKEGIKKGITTVYSCETPIKESLQYTDGTRYKKSFYGTISYMPSLFGLYMASWVIRQAYSLPNKE